MAKNNLKLKTTNYELARRAFTLVEVLIVVAILGILAAIVMPEVQGYTEKAKESAAKENLRQIRSVLQNQGVSEMLPTFDKATTNPFNDLGTIRPVTGEFPSEATGQYGWIYKASTLEVRLDWPGTDSEGVRYYDY